MRCPQAGRCDVLLADVMLDANVSNPQRPSDVSDVPLFATIVPSPDKTRDAQSFTMPGAPCPPVPPVPPLPPLPPFPPPPPVPPLPPGQLPEPYTPFPPALP